MPPLPDSCVSCRASSRNRNPSWNGGCPRRRISPDDTGASSLWPNSCTLTGIFDPADGSFPIDATLDVSSGMTQVGALPVVAPGTRPSDGTSVYIVGSRGWIEPATLELTALAALVVWAVLVVRAWRERRRHQKLLATPGYVDGGRHRRGTG